MIRFVVEGLGTPFPAAPTKNLVVGGLYRYVRNPMYLAVIAIILGQAAILGSAVLLVYAAIFWVIVASFVRFYEEPTLAAGTASSTPPTAARSEAGGRGRRPGGATTAARAQTQPRTPPPARPSRRFRITLQT